MQADGNTSTSRIEQADRLVWQLPGRNIPVRKLDCRFESFVENLNFVVLFHGRRHAAHHQDRSGFIRFIDLDGLEPASQCGIFLDMLFVFGKCGSTDRSQRAASQCRLQQVGGIASPCRTAGTDQRVGFVDKQNHRFGAGLDFVNDRAKSLFEFPLHAGTGL